MKKALYKVPNGKLLKIFLEENAGVIVSIKITGDFFAYPEEHIEQLEDFLRSTKMAPDELRAKIADFMKKSPTTLFGMDAESLVTTILSAA